MKVIGINLLSQGVLSVLPLNCSDADSVWKFDFIQHRTTYLFKKKTGTFMVELLKNVNLYKNSGMLVNWMLST